MAGDASQLYNGFSCKELYTTFYRINTVIMVVVVDELMLVAGTAQGKPVSGGG